MVVGGAVVVVVGGAVVVVVGGAVVVVVGGAVVVVVGASVVVVVGASVVVVVGASLVVVTTAAASRVSGSLPVVAPRSASTANTAAAAIVHRARLDQPRYVSQACRYHGARVDGQGFWFTAVPLPGAALPRRNGRPSSHSGHDGHKGRSPAEQRVPGAARREYGPAMAPSRLVLRGARLVDGTGADPVDDAVVVVEGDRIAQVGGSPPGDATEVDLSGTTLLPGLIDAHAHLTLIDAGDMAFERMSTAVAAAQIFRNCELALHAGFTTVRDAGGADAGLVVAVASGLVEGPRILPSGPILCQTGGHGDFRLAFAVHPERDIPGLASGSIVCDGPAATRQAAREAFRRGATQIKVCVSGGVVSHTDRLEDAQFSVEELRAIVEEAEARDTYVLAHSHNIRGIHNGLAAGIRSDEHATFLD